MSRAATVAFSIMPSRSPAITQRVAAVAVALLLSCGSSAGIVRGQSIADRQFREVKTTATITRRFEIYDPHSRRELQAVKEMGFTQVILDRPTLHADATELGLDVVLANWWTDETPPAEIESSIARATKVDPDRLVGISVMDEPQRNSPETPFDFYVNLYATLRTRLDRELPRVGLEISHWGPLASWDSLDYHLFVDLYRAADVMRIMPYPDLDEGDLADVYLMMQRSRALMEKADRDPRLLVILQAWTMPPKSELPTIDELRVMAYQAMLGGADTLSFYHYRPEEWAKTAGFEQRFTELMRELTHLSSQFADATIESSLGSTGILESVLLSSAGLTTTIRVNTNRTECEGLAPLAIVRVESEPPMHSAGAGDTAMSPAERCAPRSGWHPWLPCSAKRRVRWSSGH